MTKIAYFNEGSSIYDYFFLKHLSKQFDVFFVSFNSNPKYLPEGIPFIKLPMFMKKLPAHDSPRIYSTIPLSALLLKKALKNIKPDVLIGCGGLHYGLYATFSKYKPFVLFIWGSEVLVWPRFFPFRAFMKYSLKEADLVVLDSYIQAKASANLGCDTEKIVVLPWIDSREIEESVKKAKEERSIFRKRFGWRDDDLVVISTRLHEKIYDIKTLILAIPIVLQNITNIRFLLLGGGSLTLKLKSMVRKLGVQETVRFVGFVPHDEIFYYLRNSDIYVSTSLSDGTSASLLEAMMSGLACLVSNIPGNREWINDSENGMLFPVRDHEKLAQKIILLAKDNDLRKNLGEKASITVREKADWKKNSRILYEKLESLSKISKSF